MHDFFFLCFEILGTIAFAVSGAIKGVRQKMDVFGVCMLGLITAVGGGIIRDLVLGNTPPITFIKPRYALIAIATSIIIFLPFVRKFLVHHKRSYDYCLLITDTLGLATFSVIGVQVAYAGFSTNVFLLVFVGVITGVGGGVLRDMMSKNIPDIFVKNFYASASIVGVLLTCLLWKPLGETVAMIVGFVIIVALRFLAAHYRWNLPTIHDNNTDL